MKYIERFILATAIVTFLISCDGETGMYGIVEDSETGIPIEGVTVVMESYYKTMYDTTDINGWFFNFHTYSCGLVKCDGSFSISFEKDGYDYLQLDESYLWENEYYDTVIVKLTPTEVK